MSSMHGDYEKELLRKIDKWENEPVSNIAKAVGFFSAPLNWAAGKVISDSLMEKALNIAFDAASAVLGGSELVAEAKKLGFDGGELSDLIEAPLYVCDAMSATVVSRAKGVGAVEGAATGMTGIAGLAVDIPALLILVIRTIRKIGLCYGFDATSPGERTFMLQVLGAGAANSLREKQAAVEGAMKLCEIVDNRESKELDHPRNDVIGNEAFKAAVRNLAKQLCINITRRKAAQAIPIVGGGVGAAMNMMFVGDVSDASIRLYQKRRLLIPAVEIGRAPAVKKPE